MSSTPKAQGREARVLIYHLACLDHCLDRNEDSQIRQYSTVARVLVQRLRTVLGLRCTELLVVLIDAVYLRPTN